MPTAQECIKVMISSLHRRHLKPLGFRKTASTWIRPTEWPQVINIQSSQWNSADEAKITVNLGIYIEPLLLAFDDAPLKGALKEYDCQIRARIGSLCPIRTDKWWTATPSSDADELADRIFSEITAWGLLWFDRLSSFQALAEEFAATQQPLKAALAHALNGNGSDAQRWMARAFSVADHLALPRIKRLAKRHSLTLPGEQGNENSSPLDDVAS